MIVKVGNREPGAGAEVTFVEDSAMVTSGRSGKPIRLRIRGADAVAQILPGFHAGIRPSRYPYGAAGVPIFLKTSSARFLMSSSARSSLREAIHQLNPAGSAIEPARSPQN